MFLAAGMLRILALIFGPSWVKFVMRRHSSEKTEIPGTGGRFAAINWKIFFKRCRGWGYWYRGSIRSWKKSKAFASNYESIIDSNRNWYHEVGHVIQDHQGDRRLAARTKMAQSLIR